MLGDYFHPIECGWRVWDDVQCDCWRWWRGSSIEIARKPGVGVHYWWRAGAQSFAGWGMTMRITDQILRKRYHNRDGGVPLNLDSCDWRAWASAQYVFHDFTARQRGSWTAEYYLIDTDILELWLWQILNACVLPWIKNLSTGKIQKLSWFCFPKRRQVSLCRQELWMTPSRESSCSKFKQIQNSIPEVADLLLCKHE